MELWWQIGFNSVTKKLEVWIEAQTRATMDEIKKTLKVNWWTMDNIVKARVFLVDMNDYEIMNKVYAEYFPNWYFPTRFWLAVVELPAWALVEIECTAVGDTIISE